MPPERESMKKKPARRSVVRSRALGCVLFLGVSVSTATAQLGEKPSADVRVRLALEQASLKYTTDEDGDFGLLFQVSEKRTQKVFVNSRTEHYEQFEIREVWAAAYTANGSFSSMIANKLLADNELKKIGAWQTKQMRGGEYVAVFTAKIAAEMDGDRLRTVIEAIAGAADAMEEKLTGKDDF